MVKTDLLSNVLLPVAGVEDAVRSARALDALADAGSVTVLHVIEKADGAPDKASVAQREEEAEEAFDRTRDLLGEERVVETMIRYAQKVPETVFDAAEEVGASAIVFVPREGGRFVRFLTGDLSLHLITENDRPVVVLPSDETGDGDIS